MLFWDLFLTNMGVMIFVCFVGQCIIWYQNRKSGGVHYE